MTTQEAAEALGLHRSRVLHLIHNLEDGFDPARLNGVKHGRDWWLDPQEVKRFQAQPREQGWKKGRARKTHVEADG